MWKNLSRIKILSSRRKKESLVQLYWEIWKQVWESTKRNIIGCLYISSPQIRVPQIVVKKSDPIPANAAVDAT